MTVRPVDPKAHNHETQRPKDHKKKCRGHTLEEKTSFGDGKIRETSFGDEKKTKNKFWGGNLPKLVLGMEKLVLGMKSVIQIRPPRPRSWSLEPNSLPLSCACRQFCKCGAF